MMQRHVSSPRPLPWLAFVIALVAAGCAPPAPAPGPAEPAPLEVGPENLVTVARERLAVGPLISGELRAAREARVRAQSGGTVLRVGPDAGAAVAAGTVLAQIEATTLRDAVTSAESSLRSAEQALALAAREAERVERLVAGGALAARDLDLARTSVTAAQAQVDDARARLIAVRKSLQDTTVRAPFGGLVSSRQVNVGDVVAPGTELYTVIDPSSMRLEATVPAGQLQALAERGRVSFEVRGYPDQVFEGRIQRISPTADPVTRQVPIFVEIPNRGARLVAGLFAEGRVTIEEREALVVPERAVNTSGTRPWVLRLRDGVVERVEVIVGLRDERTERVELAGGVSAGDRLLAGAAQGISPGTPVRVRERQLEE